MCCLLPDLRFSPGSQPLDGDRKLGHVPARDAATDGLAGGRAGHCGGPVPGAADHDQVRFTCLGVSFDLQRVALHTLPDNNTTTSFTSILMRLPVLHSCFLNFLTNGGPSFGFAARAVLGLWWCVWTAAKGTASTTSASCLATRST